MSVDKHIIAAEPLLSQIKHNSNIIATEYNKEKIYKESMVILTKGLEDPGLVRFLSNNSEYSDRFRLSLYDLLYWVVVSKPSRSTTAITIEYAPVSYICLAIENPLESVRYSNLKKAVGYQITNVDKLLLRRKGITPNDVLQQVRTSLTQHPDTIIDD